MSGGSSSRLRRALGPHWGALLALALLLGGGLAAVDDYGVTVDDLYHRDVFLSKLEQLRGNAASIPQEHDNFYGGAFQFPLLFVEGAFGFRDARDIYLSRRLITHLFFLAGGLFAYMLGFRLFRKRLLALAAMGLFLLHPRLYAHSFINAQDIPFLVMFMAALFLSHRAFRKGTLSAFVLLGVGVGILMNLRIMGVVLLAGIPALRALDFALASGWAERKRALLTTGGVALASALTVYASLPYLWDNPLRRAIEWWAILSEHPTSPLGLHRGTLYRSVDLPVDYLPVWFSITSPPFALLLGCVGAAGILVLTGKAPNRLLRNGRLRFGWLLVGSFVSPILAVILLDANIYTGWRHLYFLWAPFALLAPFGLGTLASAARGARMRAAVYGAAGAGFAATLISMGLIHPNQQAFFNFLVDRVTPEHLRTQYTIDYWGHPMRQALGWISSNARLLPPAAAVLPLSVESLTAENIAALPGAERARLPSPYGFDLIGQDGPSWSRSNRVVHRARVYGNTIMRVETRDDLRSVYAAARRSEPIQDSAFDVYALDGALAFVMEPCAPSFLNAGVTARATPVDRNDLPSWMRNKGFESRGSPLGYIGALFDGKCVASIPLPAYPVADIRVEWWPELLTEAEAREAVRRAQEKAPPLARSTYGGRLHLGEGGLVYVKEPCDPLDTEIPFRLVAFPEDASDLPDGRRARGHERFEFEFYRIGALYEETCAAILPLPAYPVEAVRVGQIREDGSAAWTAAFSLRPERYRAAYASAAGGEPVARGAFDVHLSDGALVYGRGECEPGDTEARFFLHIVPERVGDLPEGRREFGFDNLDFDFFRKGALFDGRCAARASLPDYPVSSIRTGQYVSGVGEIWSVEVEVRAASAENDGAGEIARRPLPFSASGTGPANALPPALVELTSPARGDVPRKEQRLWDAARANSVLRRAVLGA